MTASTNHGPLFVGFLFNATLYGTMLVQSYFYFKRFRTDKLWTRMLVVAIIVLDTLNTVFDFGYLYDSLINHFDDDSFLAKATWFFATDPILTGLLACLGQLFYAWRVKVLTGNIWLTLLVVACALLGLAGGVATTVEILLTPQFADFIHFKSTIIIWLGAECLADILITAILVLHLSSHKSGLEASDLVVDRIIRLTMQTGLATVVCAIVDMVLFLAIPSGLHLAFNIPLCKLYSNSLLSSLNARSLQGAGSGNSSGKFGLVVLKRTTAQPPPQQFGRTGVFVDVEHVTDKVDDLNGLTSGVSDDRDSQRNLKNVAM
ncbi:hypothetical protein C8R45DRAFT_264696 [Mycena sanguinolenta]|nr:hypothetical protein C8R45DRAFT_264696 [Mycena sanguinolenta]